MCKRSSQTSLNHRTDCNRDLDMSTSLDVQAIDSKVDDLAVKQTSSHQMTVSHLEKIQEGVEAVEALQHTAHQTTLDSLRSTDRTHEALHDIRMSQTASQQAARLQAEKLDATLAAIQRSLLSTARPARPRPRSRRIGRTPHVTPIADIKECKDHAMLGVFSELVQRTTNPSTIPAQLNRLVDLAVTVRYRCGKAHFEPLALPDPEFEAASFETKLRMVKYLQDLRLLLWLLCRKEYFCDRAFQLTSLPQSQLIPEARLVSSWTVWTTLEIASLRSKTKLRCRDGPFLRYLLFFRSESLEFRSNLRTEDPHYPPIGLRMWHIDLMTEQLRGVLDEKQTLRNQCTELLLRGQALLKTAVVDWVFSWTTFIKDSVR